VPGISIHVVDVARGLVAAGMRVEVFALAPARIRLADAAVASTGVVDDVALSARFEAGAYEAVLHVAAFYRAAGVVLPAVPFLDVVTYRFGIADPAQHYHLPFKLTPWGYSCFRGGA
jgi:5-hydroxyisourate hydrolase